jgi:HK97 family phage major capsid protein
MDGFENLDIDVTGSKEPEVVQGVVEQLKKFGGAVKQNFEELHKNHEELKKLVDEKDAGVDDALIDERIVKYTEDITTRQQAIDQALAKQEKDFTERVDQIEVALKRHPKAAGVDGADWVKEARDFYLSAIAARNEEKGLTYDRVQDLKIEERAAEFAEYKSTFEKFLRKDEKGLGPDDFKALSVGSDPDGGYTVTPAMSNRIIQRLYESDPIRQLAASESITTGALEWLVDWDEAGWGWEAETETGDETGTPQLKKKRIPVHVMYAKPKATQVLIEDSGINIENWLANKVASRFMRGEGAAFVSGDGVGKPRGFLTYPDGTNYGQVEQVAMGAAAALTADGFIDVKYSLKEYFLNRGTWIMNRLTVADAMKLKDGAGDYIWKPGLTNDQQSTLLGLPARMSTSMPTVAAGARAVALADWAEAYMVVDRLGITIQRDPYTAKPFIEFYTRKRVGGDVVNYEAIKLGVISV